MRVEPVPGERISMTADQIDKLSRLGRCVMVPGTWDKRFVRDLRVRPTDYELSAKQAEELERIWQRYRRQWQ